MTAPYNTRLETVISVNGNGSPQMSCDMPSSLKENLRRKAIAIPSLTLGNTNIPIFVPELATPATLAYNTTATSNTLIGANGGMNALDYFVVVRKIDNSVACASIVQWTNTNGIPAPFSIPNEGSVISTPYYHCFDFSQFMKMVLFALQSAMQSVVGLLGIILTLDSETNTFNLSVDQSFNVGAYQIEFSPKLISLFPFQRATTPYSTSVIQWSDILVDLNASTFYNSTAPLYSTIFPFDLILMGCNLPMMPVEFVTNVISQYPLNEEIFFVFQKVGPSLNIYDSFTALNPYTFDKLHRFKEDSQGDNRLKIRLILRTRRGKNYINWDFPATSEILIMLNTFEI